MDEVESEALVAPEPASAPAAVADFNEAAVDVDGEKYREVIERRNGSNKSRLGDINTEGRPRSCSFTSASSFSPTISTDAATGAPEIPFSIEQPQPMDILEEQLLTMSYTSSPKGANDNRPPSTPTTRYRQDGPRYRTSMMTLPSFRLTRKECSVLNL